MEVAGCFTLVAVFSISSFQMIVSTSSNYLNLNWMPYKHILCRLKSVVFNELMLGYRHQFLYSLSVCADDTPPASYKFAFNIISIAEEEMVFV